MAMKRTGVAEVVCKDWMERLFWVKTSRFLLGGWWLVLFGRDDREDNGQYGLEMLEVDLGD